VQEITAKLEGVRDPVSGQRAVFKCYPAATCYSGPCRDEGPDLVVGYNRGYRASWQTALGKVPQGLFETNRKRWSGDHCMASDLLPGIVVGNRKPVRREGLRLEDVTATLLAAYGIPKPPEYTGKSIL
jgi:predicted AlkP superfamily phosphohydrolase/phosphomutase